MIALSLLFVLLMNQNAFANCVPARETVKFNHEGHYHRVHPSGNYVLYTAGKQSVIVDISDRSNPKSINTPMREEAYPVEAAGGGWDYIAAPKDGGSHGIVGGTDYYSFDQLLNPPADASRQQAKPVYTDPNHGQYYLSSAELSGSTKKVKTVRTLLYSDQSYRDYKMEHSPSGEMISVAKSPRKILCGNILPKDGKSPEIHAAYNAKKEEMKSQYDKAEKEAKSRSAPQAELDKLKTEFRSTLDKMDNDFYGPQYKLLKEKYFELEEKHKQVEAQVNNSAEIQSVRKKTSEAEEELRLANDRLTKDSQIAKIRAQHEQLAKKYQEQTGAEQEKTRLQLVELVQQFTTTYSSVQEKSGIDKAYAKLKMQKKAEAEFAKTSSLLQLEEKLNLEKQDVAVKTYAFTARLQLINPIQSKDGAYVAGLVANKLEVFKVKPNGDCESVAKTDYRGSKVSFSYPEAGKLPQITFTTEGGAATGYDKSAYVYDLKSKVSKKVSTDQDEEPYYPGFTRDGRIIFKTKEGFSIVDPNQMGDKTNKCIPSSSASGKNSSEKTQKARQ